jgi:hypothetical protein
MVTGSSSMLWLHVVPPDLSAGNEFITFVVGNSQRYYVVRILYVSFL